MPENSRGQNWIDVTYTSTYGVHRMGVSTNVIVEDGTKASGFAIATAGAGSADLQSKVEQYIALIADMCHTSITFTSFIAYDQNVPSDPVTPMYTASLDIDGTSAAAGIWRKAVQSTLVWRTQGFGIFKIVLLDNPATTFEPLNALPSTSSALDILHEFLVGDNNSFLGRDDERPVTFLGASYTLNEKLRRAYRMT